MTTSRLSLALESGEIDPLPGGLYVLNAPGDLVLSGLDAILSASQSFYPDYERLSARGIEVKPILDRQALGGPTLNGPSLNRPGQHALVFCHRSKAATRALVAQALDLLPPGATVLVDGAKTSGIEPLLKDLRRLFDGVQAYSKAHGKLVWLQRPPQLPVLEGWRDATYLYPNGWVTHAASFSSAGPDTGSKLLAAHLPDLKGKVADLGAGWGYLSGEILKSETVTELRGYEAEYHSVTCAQHNVQDPRAAFEWCDVGQISDSGFDAVVTNPPFHTSRTPDTDLGVTFIRKAADILAPKGVLWMVANRGLPYEPVLEDRFSRVHTVIQSAGFKVIQALGPKNPRR